MAMFCHFASSLEAVAKEDVERVLDRLDREIRRVDAYKQLREEGIDSVKQVRRDCVAEMADGSTARWISPAVTVLSTMIRQSFIMVRVY